MATCHGSAPNRWSGACTSQAWSGNDPLLGPYGCKEISASPSTVLLLDKGIAGELKITLLVTLCLERTFTIVAPSKQVGTDVRCTLVTAGTGTSPADCNAGSARGNGAASTLTSPSSGLPGALLGAGDRMKMAGSPCPSTPL